MADTNNPLQDMQAAAASLCRKLAEVYSDPKPSYTLPSGASVDRNAYRQHLLDELSQMKKDFPGVVPDLSPVFEVWG